MSQHINTPDLSASLLKNQVLKTRILLTLFIFIFLVQTIMISVMYFTHNSILKTLPVKGLIFGPVFILIGAFCEYLYLRRLYKHIRMATSQTPLFSYLVVFIEAAFPGALMLLVVSITGNTSVLPVTEIISSPPFVFYFIIVILSSLNLDKKISIFCGLIAGLQYSLLCFYFKSHYALENLYEANIIAKSVLIFISGLVSGFVSDKIKQALLDALHAQDSLINKLDTMVHEKTKEITLQKLEIEKQHDQLQDKNKEIIDSIHYARRIQQALLPSDKYIEKHLTKQKDQLTGIKNKH